MITPKDITEYSDLVSEIKEMEKEIARKEHEVLTDVVSGSSPDDPYTQHSISVHGVSGADRLRSRLKRRVAELDERRAEIEAFVDGLPRSSQRRIVRMRMEGLSWGEITARMGSLLGRKGEKNLSKNFLNFVPFVPIVPFVPLK